MGGGKSGCVPSVPGRLKIQGSAPEVASTAFPPSFARHGRMTAPEREKRTFREPGAGATVPTRALPLWFLRLSCHDVIVCPLPS
jgi:hypothetical protein